MDPFQFEIQALGGLAVVLRPRPGSVSDLGDGMRLVTVRARRAPALELDGSAAVLRLAGPIEVTEAADAPILGQLLLRGEPGAWEAVDGSFQVNLGHDEYDEIAQKFDFPAFSPGHTRITPFGLRLTVDAIGLIPFASETIGTRYTEVLVASSGEGALDRWRHVHPETGSSADVQPLRERVRDVLARSLKEWGVAVRVELGGVAAAADGGGEDLWNRAGAEPWWRIKLERCHVRLVGRRNRLRYAAARPGGGPLEDLVLYPGWLEARRSRDGREVTYTLREGAPPGADFGDPDVELSLKKSGSEEDRFEAELRALRIGEDDPLVLLPPGSSRDPSAPARVWLRGDDEWAALDPEPAPEPASGPLRRWPAPALPPEQRTTTITDWMDAERLAGVAVDLLLDNTGRAALEFTISRKADGGMFGPPAEVVLSCHGAGIRMITGRHGVAAHETANPLLPPYDAPPATPGAEAPDALRPLVLLSERLCERGPDAPYRMTVDYDAGAGTASGTPARLALKLLGAPRLTIWSRVAGQPLVTPERWSLNDPAGRGTDARGGAGAISTLRGLVPHARAIGATPTELLPGASGIEARAGAAVSPSSPDRDALLWDLRPDRLGLEVVLGRQGEERLRRYWRHAVPLLDELYRRTRLDEAPTVAAALVDVHDRHHEPGGEPLAALPAVVAPPAEDDPNPQPGNESAHTRELALDDDHGFRLSYTLPEGEEGNDRAARWILQDRGGGPPTLFGKTLRPFGLSQDARVIRCHVLYSGVPPLAAIVDGKAVEIAFDEAGANIGEISGGFVLSAGELCERLRRTLPELPGAPDSFLGVEADNVALERAGNGAAELLLTELHGWFRAGTGTLRLPLRQTIRLAADGGALIAEPESAAGWAVDLELDEGTLRAVARHEFPGLAIREQLFSTAEADAKHRYELLGAGDQVLTTEFVAAGDRVYVAYAGAVDPDHPMAELAQDVHVEVGSVLRVYLRLRRDDSGRFAAVGLIGWDAGAAFGLAAADGHRRQVTLHLLDKGERRLDLNGVWSVALESHRAAHRCAFEFLFWDRAVRLKLDEDGRLELASKPQRIDALSHCTVWTTDAARDPELNTYAYVPLWLDRAGLSISAVHAVVHAAERPRGEILRYRRPTVRLLIEASDAVPGQPKDRVRFVVLRGRLSRVTGAAVPLELDLAQKEIELARPADLAMLDWEDFTATPGKTHEGMSRALPESADHLELRISGGVAGSLEHRAFTLSRDPGEPGNGRWIGCPVLDLSPAGTAVSERREPALWILKDDRLQRLPAFGGARDGLRARAGRVLAYARWRYEAVLEQWDENTGRPIWQIVDSPLLNIGSGLSFFTGEGEPPGTRSSTPASPALFPVASVLRPGSAKPPPLQLVGSSRTVSPRTAAEGETAPHTALMLTANDSADEPPPGRVVLGYAREVPFAVGPASGPTRATRAWSPAALAADPPWAAAPPGDVALWLESPRPGERLGYYFDQVLQPDDEAAPRRVEAELRLDMRTPRSSRTVDPLTVVATRLDGGTAAGDAASALVAEPDAGRVGVRIEWSRERTLPIEPDERHVAVVAVQGPGAPAWIRPGEPLMLAAHVRGSFEEVIARLRGDDDDEIGDPDSLVLALVLRQEGNGELRDASFVVSRPSAGTPGPDDAAKGPHLAILLASAVEGDRRLAGRAVELRVNVADETTWRVELRLLRRGGVSGLERKGFAALDDPGGHEIGEGRFYAWARNINVREIPGVGASGRTALPELIGVVRGYGEGDDVADEVLAAYGPASVQWVPVVREDRLVWRQQGSVVERVARHEVETMRYRVVAVQSDGAAAGSGWAGVVE